MLSGIYRVRFVSQPEVLKQAIQCWHTISTRSFSLISNICVQDYKSEKLLTAGRSLHIELFSSNLTYCRMYSGAATIFIGVWCALWGDIFIDKMQRVCWIQIFPFSKSTARQFPFLAAYYQVHQQLKQLEVDRCSSFEVPPRVNLLRKKGMWNKHYTLNLHILPHCIWFICSGYMLD